MRPRVNPLLLFLLLVAASVSLATVIERRAAQWLPANPSSLLKVIFGDGRRLFSNHFFVKADVSFHSGYYPSIFDRAQAPKDSRHLTAPAAHSGEEGHEGHDHETNPHPPDPDEHGHEKDEHGHEKDEHAGETHDDHEAEHYRQMDFLGPPRDWIERFGRRAMITDHTHLEGGKEREILPWLKISAELDPQRIETYTVSSFWLRNMGRIQEAEQFLREGLRNNPDSYEILFELGRLYYENQHDVTRARNVWELALKKWTLTEPSKKEPDLLTFEQIALNLERLEESEHNWDRAIQLLELAKKAAAHPEALEKQIQDLKAKGR